MIDLLLSSGADKSVVDVTGMTAFGYFHKIARHFRPLVSPSDRVVMVFLESKLCPPGGPTLVDVAEKEYGLVDYTAVDEFAANPNSPWPVLEI